MARYSTSLQNLSPGFMPPIFLTENGLPVPAATADQMIEVDRLALEETGPNRFQMMENTGYHLAQQALDCLSKSSAAPKRDSDALAITAQSSKSIPLQLFQAASTGDSMSASEAQKPASRAAKHLASKTVVVLAGGGMNGGGGICAARHLANRGLTVYLCLSSLESLSNISRWQYHLFHSSQGLEVDTEALCQADWQTTHGPVDLIVDALMGCRVPQAPQGNDLALINWANQSGSPILSLDIPSGMDATQGEIPGAVMQSCWTLTLALPKTGMHPDLTGELILADIGIPAKTFRAKSLGFPYRSPFGPSRRVSLQYQTATPEVA